MRISDWSSDVCSSDLCNFGCLVCSVYPRTRRRDQILQLREHIQLSGEILANLFLQLDAKGLCSRDGVSQVLCLADCMPHMLRFPSNRWVNQRQICASWAARQGRNIQGRELAFARNFGTEADSSSANRANVLS